MADSSYTCPEEDGKMTAHRLWTRLDGDDDADTRQGWHYNHGRSKQFKKNGAFHTELEFATLLAEDKTRMACGSMR